MIRCSRCAHVKHERGCSANGLRVVDDKPAGLWRATTIRATMGLSGVTAAMVTLSAINSVAFRGFVEEFLAPAPKLGDVVVMDNMAVQKVKAVEESIQAAGAELLYLPPYSPELKPIEKARSNVKSHLRGLLTEPTQMTPRRLG